MNEPPYVGCEDWLRLDAEPRIWLKKDGSEALGPCPNEAWSVEIWKANAERSFA